MFTTLLQKYPDLEICNRDMESAFHIMRDSIRSGGTVLCCGNGGSASDSEHIVGELMKGFMLKRTLPVEWKREFTNAFKEDGEYISEHLQGAIPAISLVSHTALSTAFANDIAADMIFAQQVFGYGRKGDVLIGLSTSGNSANVLHAMKVAKVKGMRAIGLTGKTGGRMAQVCDVTIKVPWESTPDIQERHLPVYHALCILLEEEFFRDRFFSRD